jgi:hypothetical protein
MTQAVTLRIGDWSTRVNPHDPYYKTIFSSLDEAGGIPEVLEYDWVWFPEQWSHWEHLRGMIEENKILPKESVYYTKIQQLHLAFLDLPVGWQKYVVFDIEPEERANFILELGQQSRSAPTLRTGGQSCWDTENVNVVGQCTHHMDDPRFARTTEHPLIARWLWMEVDFTSPLDEFPYYIALLKVALSVYESLVAFLLNQFQEHINNYTGILHTYIRRKSTYWQENFDQRVGRVGTDSIDDNREEYLSAIVWCQEYRRALDRIDGEWLNSLYSRSYVEASKLPWNSLESLARAVPSLSRIGGVDSYLRNSGLHTYSYIFPQGGRDIINAYIGSSPPPTHELIHRAPTTQYDVLGTIRRTIHTLSIVTCPPVYGWPTKYPNVSVEMTDWYTVFQAPEKGSNMYKEEQVNDWTSLVRLSLQALVRLSIVGQDRDLRESEEKQYNRRLARAFWFVLGDRGSMEYIPHLCRLYAVAAGHTATMWSDKAKSVNPPRIDTTEPLVIVKRCRTIINHLTLMREREPGREMKERVTLEELQDHFASQHV